MTNANNEPTTETTEQPAPESVAEQVQKMAEVPMGLSAGFRDIDESHREVYITITCSDPAVREFATMLIGQSIHSWMSQLQTAKELRVEQPLPSAEMANG